MFVVFFLYVFSPHPFACDHHQIIFYHLRSAWLDHVQKQSKIDSQQQTKKTDRKQSDDHASTDSLASNPESEAILRKSSVELEKKRVIIVRFNDEPSTSNKKTSMCTNETTSSTHLMPQPPQTILKKVSITSSTFTEDLDGYLDASTLNASNTAAGGSSYDAADDDHVRKKKIKQLMQPTPQYQNAN